MSRAVRRAATVEEVRRIARRRLPATIFGIIEGGAEDELTCRANRTALERILFRPRALVDTSHRDLSTTVLGHPISMPVMLAPTGASSLVDGEGELAAARAAARAGTVYVQSTAMSRPLREVAAAAGGSLWFQLYLAEDRRMSEALLDAATAAGCRVLCVTIDNAVRGARERDRRYHRSRPRVVARVLAEATLQPRWSWHVLRRDLRRGGIPGGRVAPNEAGSAVRGRPVAWDDIAWLRQRWPGPLVVKGVASADPCPRLVDHGIDAVVVSNHGGRQLDSLPAAVDVLPEVVDAVGDRAEVLVDGGIRRGSDVAKALALGARAVFVGRPYLYGLAAAGEDGVVRVLDILRAELDRTLALLGCTSPADVDARVVRNGDLRSGRAQSVTTV
jgi:isopentenyl diphosphate isomerase/L-lactate dehydrogenase-like FMN-dependent dehydrogenase